jgi:hypothetical protein
MPTLVVKPIYPKAIPVLPVIVEEPAVLDALVTSRTQTLEDLASAHHETIDLLKEKLDLNQRQSTPPWTFSARKTKNVPPERLASKLLEVAQRFKELQETAIGKPGDDPKIAALKADAQKAIGRGDLDTADKLLADVEVEQGRTLDRLAGNRADTAARRGDMAPGTEDAIEERYRDSPFKGKTTKEWTKRE